MHPLDWLIMSLPLSIVAIIGIYTRSRVKSVAHFMAGGRYAGRYLLCNARSEMGAGAVLAVPGYEVFSRAGVCLGWWGNLTNIIIVVAWDRRIRHLPIPADSIINAGAVFRNALQPEIPPLCRRAGFLRRCD
jgi:Na+/proline symporter